MIRNSLILPTNLNLQQKDSDYSRAKACDISLHFQFHTFSTEFLSFFVFLGLDTSCQLDTIQPVFSHWLENIGSANFPLFLHIVSVPYWLLPTSLVQKPCRLGIFSIMSKDILVWLRIQRDNEQEPLSPFYKLKGIAPEKEASSFGFLSPSGRFIRQRKS